MAALPAGFDVQAALRMLGQMHAAPGLPPICFNEYALDGLTLEQFRTFMERPGAQKAIVSKAAELLGKERKAHMRLDELAANAFHDIDKSLRTAGAEKLRISNRCCTVPACPITAYHGCLVTAIKEAFRDS